MLFQLIKVSSGIGNEMKMLIKGKILFSSSMMKKDFPSNRVTQCSTIRVSSKNIILKIGEESMASFPSSSITVFPDSGEVEYEFNGCNFQIQSFNLDSVEAAKLALELL